MPACSPELLPPSVANCAVREKHNGRPPPFSVHVLAISRCAIVPHCRHTHQSRSESSAENGVLGSLGHRRRVKQVPPCVYHFESGPSRILGRGGSLHTISRVAQCAGCTTGRSTGPGRMNQLTSSRGDKLRSIVNGVTFQAERYRPFRHTGWEGFFFSCWCIGAVHHQHCHRGPGGVPVPVSFLIEVCWNFPTRFHKR